MVRLIPICLLLLSGPLLGCTATVPCASSACPLTDAGGSVDAGAEFERDAGPERDGGTDAGGAPEVDAGAESDGGRVDGGGPPPTPWSQLAYVKASNTRAGFRFGDAVAISGNGVTLAVGSTFEGSSAQGISGAAPMSGAVYVFTRGAGGWQQQAFLKASNAGADDSFGNAIALSDDGDTLAIGSPGDDSASTGVNGDQVDAGAPLSGAVFVFIRVGTTWQQQAYLKASNPGAHDVFGAQLALSGDGNTLVVGASNEDSNARGPGGDETNDLATQSGAAYVFSRSGTTWTQHAYLKASNSDPDDLFGNAVAISSDGQTIAVAARGEGSESTGVNQDQLNDRAPASGAVYVFARSGTRWVQTEYVKPSNTRRNASFGRTVELSHDGSVLAVGAPGDASPSRGINGDQSLSLSTQSSGAVFLLRRVGGVLAQEAFVKASNADPNDLFGLATALSDDGETLFVGAFNEAGAGIGFNADESTNSQKLSGAAYIFRHRASGWAQDAYVKASNARADSLFGASVASSSDGRTLAAGAIAESSGAMGVNGAQTDQSAPLAGSVYVFGR
ncbi:MAG: hypothetical protein SFW67_22000 [Myxococcaceae bacterium]|nr:hypothetical protein [Myxococcaceae bacterium]